MCLAHFDDARFDEYENQVHTGYVWAPAFLFRSKRRDILQGLLARPSIDSAARFQNQLEKRAREILARSLSKL